MDPWNHKGIHGAAIVSMELLGWIIGTTWIHQWICDLYNRFQMWAMYTWNCFVDPWIHLP